MGSRNLHPLHKRPSPAPPERSPVPQNIADDTVPRRVVLRQLKEGLLKSAILIGVPRVIEACLALVESGVVEEGAKDNGAFVRRAWEDMTGEEILRRGDEGLGRVYRDDIEGIWEKMGDGMLDIRFMCRFLTYGTFLSPVTPEAPLDFQLTEHVVLSTLIPQRTHREILWHLRGALRSGMTREEVEEVQRAAERCCEEMGVQRVGEGMPRVVDVHPDSV